MEESASTQHGMSSTHVAVYVIVVALACAAGGYAIHEHSTAKNLAASNAQTSAALNSTEQQLNSTQQQMSDLSAKVDKMATAQAAAAPAAQHRAIVVRQADNARYKKLQTQLDAQGKAIDDTQTELQGTQGDLQNARTELTGSIAHTHDELVLLEKKGELSYTEFDLSKAKQFKREGPMELRLKKADGKHQFADMELMVDDRNLSQKHVNLYQPVMFYTPDSPQPMQVVINAISKDHIHGYVAASKYRQSELTAMAANNTDNGAAATTNAGTDANAGTTNSSEPATGRQRLPMPQQ